MFPEKVDGRIFFQDIGNDTLPLDIRQSIVDLGNLYLGSSRRWEDVVTFQDYYNSTVVIDCDEFYYTGVLNSNLYEAYLNSDTRPVSETRVFLPSGELDFIYSTFGLPPSKLKHISQAPCCFKTFLSDEDHTLYQNTVIRKVTTYGTKGKFSPCLKFVKPKQIIYDSTMGSFSYA